MACRISHVLFALPQRLQLRNKYNIKISLAFSFLQIFDNFVLFFHRESMIIDIVGPRIFSDCPVSLLER